MIVVLDGPLKPRQSARLKIERRDGRKDSVPLVLPPVRGDGRRILVERLWPRGVKKDALAADAWLKDVAPSTELRKWFGHRVERWQEFRDRYQAELDANPGAFAPILDAAQTGTVTLLFSAHDTLHKVPSSFATT